MKRGSDDTLDDAPEGTMGLKAALEAMPDKAEVGEVGKKDGREDVRHDVD